MLLTGKVLINWLRNWNLGDWGGARLGAFHRQLPTYALHFLFNPHAIGADEPRNDD